LIEFKVHLKMHWFVFFCIIAPWL